MSKLNEKLSKSSDLYVWIDDFVNSTDARFKGKDNNKRIEMAIAAYYDAQHNGSVSESTSLGGVVAIDVSAWVAVHGDNFATSNFWIFAKKPSVNYGTDVAGVDYYVASNKYSAAVAGAAEWAVKNGVDILYLQNSSVTERRAYAIAQRALGEKAEVYAQSRFHFLIKESNQTLAKIALDNSALNT